MNETRSENTTEWHGHFGVHRCLSDEVNRLKSLCGTSEGARYEYRADGMRVMKIADLTISWNPNDTEEGSGFYDEILSVNKPTTRYFYDGQMPMEEDFKITGGFGSPTVTVTQYGLGARGIDYIRNKVGNDPETIVFPLYDGHGNMVYTLSRGGNDTFSLGNKRIYGVWGDLRYDGNPNAGPNTQYCANLGHKKDGETDLIYMRARYYEPWTGRFISEDPAADGWNWYVYCANNPIERGDYDGNTWIEDHWPLIKFALEILAALAAIDLGKRITAKIAKLSYRFTAEALDDIGKALIKRSYAHFAAAAILFSEQRIAGSFGQLVGFLQGARHLVQAAMMISAGITLRLIAGWLKWAIDE